MHVGATKADSESPTWTVGRNVHKSTIEGICIQNLDNMHGTCRLLTEVKRHPLAMVGLSVDPVKISYRGLCLGDAVQLEDNEGVMRKCR